MTQSTQNSTLESCVRAVWLRRQRKHVISGLLAMFRWGVPLFFVGMFIDRYAYLPKAGRLGILIVLALVSLYQAWRNGWCRLRRYDSTSTAMLIEERQGGLDSLLTSAIELGRSDASPGTSQSLCEATLKKAEIAAADLKPEKIITLSSLRLPVRIAMGLGAAVLIFAIIKGPFLAAGLTRIFAPWATVAYPTKTKLNIEKADLVVKEGASALVAVVVSGEVPDFATFLLRTGDGKPREIELAIEDGQAIYSIESASRNFSYRVKAGDTRSEWHEVRVISAPRVKKVALDLEFPTYLERENETVEAMTLTVPESTKIHWYLELDRPIRSAVLNRDGEEPTELKISDDGRQLVIDEEVDASRGYSFDWVEREYGFEFSSPRYYLQVASDQSPRVELVSPEANVSAMLNRPLDLVVRAQDDHGIGTTKITYRVNRRPEKTITLPEGSLDGSGAQKLDWDYRQELPDLEVGDSVSFVIEVADKYPGENGPHRAATESRRITFLSREEYLAGITKKMERLLTRVRSLYRQERGAHELVRSLEPAADSYLPTCQLEAIRQEMVREQLIATSDEVDALLEDLAANQVSDAVESDSLASLRDSLRTIATEHVARAADLLRNQVGADALDPQPAIAAVNEAARELAGLVLQRGIDAAREVFARETHMLSRELATLRKRLISSTPDQAESLAAEHEAVAAWTETLLNRLTEGMRYDKKPLAILGLSRRIYELRTGKVADQIRQAALLARDGKTAEAAEAQYPLIRPLLEAEFTMRSGSEYALIRDLREQLGSLMAGQKELLESCEGLDDFNGKIPDLKEQQTKLRDSLVLASLPKISAPRTRLFDMTLPPVPPSDKLRLAAEEFMTASAEKITAGEKDKAVASQRAAIESLEKLDKVLTRWSAELAQRVLGVSALVSDATNRAGALEQLETLQIGLLEQTEEAALDEKNPANLVEDQKALAMEVDLFRKDLSVEGSEPAKEILPLLGRLEVVMATMNLAANALQQKKLEDALEPQEEAAMALSEARALAERQLTQLNLLQQLIAFEQAVAGASEGMADIVGGQNDLIAATKEADEDALEPLLDPQRNLLQCLSDIAPSLDLVAARLDVGTPLVFAASDVEDALLAMEDGDGEDAAEIQEIAVESLAKVKGLVSEISVQTGYLAEIVEFLHEAQSDAALLAFRQRQLREKPVKDSSLAEQQALASDTKEYGRLLSEVAGVIDFDQLSEQLREKLGEIDLTVDFAGPAEQMAEAVRLLKSGEGATDSMLAAEEALTANSDQLLLIISMLNGLPTISVTNADPPELHRLIKILDIASKHRGLLRETQGAAKEKLSEISVRQAKLTEELATFKAGETSHPTLIKAHREIEPIVAALEGADKNSALAAQLASDRSLRHFVIEQALILNTAVPPASSSDADVLTEAETDDLYEAEAVGFVSDFVSGEAPKDKESEWKILGDRNRAALNQNFARELPLEYRATLKNYYERVAK
ncbi:MAG: hypothetical protein AB8D78_05470 [Akkermansiaceae bacterium]